MTANQIAYQNLVETNRSNLVREAETGRHNLAVETETSRHNVAEETETKRSNLAREFETNRHNVRTENQTDRQLSENERHNRATEQLGFATLAETQTHNRAQESIGAANVEASRYGSALNYAANVYGTDVRHEDAFLDRASDREIRREQMKTQLQVAKTQQVTQLFGLAGATAKGIAKTVSKLK